MRARLLVETLLIEMLCVRLVLAISVNQGWSAWVHLPASIKATSHLTSNLQVLLEPVNDTSAIQARTQDVAETDASPAANVVLVAQGTRPLFRTAIAAGRAQAEIASGKVDQHDQQAAQDIQQAVAGFLDGHF